MLLVADSGHSATLHGHNHRHLDGMASRLASNESHPWIQGFEPEGPLNQKARWPGSGVLLDLVVGGRQQQLVLDHRSGLDFDHRGFFQIVTLGRAE